MAVANVRQWGVGNPDLPRRAPSAATGKPPKPNSIACALWWRTGKGSGTSLLAWAAAKARRAFPDPLAPFSSVPVRRSSDPRWAHGSAFAVCEGWAAHAPRTGVGGQRSHGWQSADASERAEARMAAANVRQWGVGNPDLPRRAPSAATGKTSKAELNRIRAAVENRQGERHKSPRVGRGEGSSSVPRPPRSLCQCACVAAPAIRDGLSSITQRSLEITQSAFFEPVVCGLQTDVARAVGVPPDR